MSAFSDVDAAADPKRLIASLEESARGLASMKHYMAAAHARLDDGGWILDVGCGAGHDIAVLAQHGIDRVVGVDPSAVMLDKTRQGTASPLARATGACLPFRGGSFSGSWIERVLMHASDPLAILAEVVRVVVPGGTMTVFEPDWSSLHVNAEPVPTEWVTLARHPSIGSDVGVMLQELGCLLLDRVEERSWWTFAQFEAITSRAVFRSDAGDDPAVREWIEAMRTAAERGAFEAEMIKVLWVSTTPPRAGRTVAASPKPLAQQHPSAPGSRRPEPATSESASTV